MNGFHARGRGISAHESASTIGKKIANSIEGKTTRPGILGDAPVAAPAGGRRLASAARALARGAHR